MPIVLPQCILGFILRCNIPASHLPARQPQHSRPHDGRTDSMVLREKFQLNYDPEDLAAFMEDVSSLSTVPFFEYTPVN